MTKNIRELLIDGDKQESFLQEIAHFKHTENNCKCGNHSGEKYILRSDGAGDIVMCLDCFGALGCVY